MNNEPKVTNNEKKGINSKQKYSWVPNRRPPPPLLIIGESFNPDKPKGKINPNTFNIFQNRLNIKFIEKNLLNNH